MRSDPVPGHKYVFVRNRDGRLEHTQFTRYADGSAGFLADRSFHIFENQVEAWRKALVCLEDLGFVELEEARSRGLVPPEWQPTPESSCATACQSLVEVQPAGSASN
jgi:hypothetical protein